MKSLFSPMKTIAATILGALLMFSAGAHNGESHDKATPGEPYPLDTCPVTGKLLDAMGDPVVKVINDREFRFCCAGCPPKVEAEPEKYIPNIDAAITKLQRPFYPLETCVVSGEELGTMGKLVEFVYNNRLVRLCCGSCVSEFKTDAAAHLAKIDAAVVEAQASAYPLDFCLVSGDKLGGEMGDPIDVVIENRLYRVCCKGCIKSLYESPVKYRNVLDDALAGKPVKRPEGSGSKGHGDNHEVHGHDEHKQDEH